jgi:hypothetical protein
MKDHIKHPDFRHANVSALESHPRSGKTLKTPFSKLGGELVSKSWLDECIPNTVWACILASRLERGACLDLFRSVVTNTRAKVGRRKETFVTHNFIATLSDAEFDTMFAGVLANKDAMRALSALKLLDCLPDRSHWDRHLSDPDPKESWQVLMEAVGKTADHQSQEATDIRWLRLMHLIVCQERIVFDTKFRELVDEMMHYNKGDMRSVRPMIRAAEMTTRAIEYGQEPTLKDDGKSAVELPPRHVDAFWAELREKTECIVTIDAAPLQAGPDELCDEVLTLYQALEGHFHATAASTAPDARHDGAFGLTLYALTLLFDASASYGHSLVEGRIMLRTVVEALITLRYLTAKDDINIWSQYRSYGSGQALKNLREEDVPAFVDLTLLEFLANEDMWLELQDIKLGHWADLDLRKMSVEAGVKEVYDKYYDLASGYSHGHWACVRDTVFTTCLNPLHRFHRVPGPAKRIMPSVLVDACKLVNRMLDDLNHLYPAFKPRLKWHHQVKQVTDTGAIEVAVDQVIAANPDKVAQVKAKPAALGWFVGQVMKATGGKANPQAVNELLRKKLGA